MTRKSEITDNLDIYKGYLKRMIGIRSVISEDALPFGSGINEALDEILSISKEMGFEVYKDPEGYYGYAQMGSGELFGVLCHVDVVDEGYLNDWNHEPYTLHESNGKLFGRGTIDDKGPTLAALFALRLLLDEGFKLNKRVRFIFGTDEESLWRCLDAYKAKEEIPVMGFAPDADFPLVHVEKGLLQLLVKGEGNAIVGGDSYNAVASHATIQDTKGLKEALNELGYRYDKQDSNIRVLGKLAHASTPEKGVNAIYHLSKALKESGHAKDLEAFVVSVYEDGKLDHFEDSVSGKISYSVGKADEGWVSLDVRYPVTYSEAEVIKAVQSIHDKVVVEKITGLDSLYVPIESELVQALMKSYQSVTGDHENEPLKIGGATYARAMDNFVAFGPLFLNQEMTAHQANEYIEIKGLIDAIEIYMNAFENLC